MEDKKNMTILYESIPYQPIEEDTEESRKFWLEKALPLVRKVFEEFKTGSKVDVGLLEG